VDIVSKNGTLLLNVGPRADGTIGPEDEAVLREIGRWLKVNGEAIYAAKPWRKAGEGPTAVEEGQFTDQVEKVFTPQDIRFTVNGDRLYATVLRWPADGRVTIRSLADADASRLPVFHGIVRRVEALGFDDRPEWRRDGEGLHIQTHGILSDNPVVFRITLD
jgi:alpha-L-fucosidase